MAFTLRPLTEADAWAIAGWRYEGPYALYNGEADDSGAMLDPANGYWAALDGQGELAGFVCLGPDARVPGGDYGDQDALDLGLGLRPDLTGQGQGAALLDAGLAFARAHFAPARFRLTVAAFNARAIKVYGRAGFVPVQRFTHAGSPALDFLVMTRPA